MYTGVSLVAQLLKNPPAMQEDPGSTPGLGRSIGERERLLTPVIWPGEFHELSMGLQRVRHNLTTEQQPLTKNFTWIDYTSHLLRIYSSNT